MIDKVFQLLGFCFEFIFVIIQMLVALSLAAVVAVAILTDWYVLSKAWEGQPQLIISTTDIFGFNVLGIGIVLVLMTIIKHLSSHADHEIAQFEIPE